ncbi:MAG: 4Fe-4S dicluster domain-containing protein [Deltaproteobacteria bacterium]|nr:MAG: 4Fe-4S dicluster domain-containing protein [Deltaproteobacteria bacterium]
MGINRREFLKIAGISAVAGLGGTSAIDLLRRAPVEASQVSPNPKALTAKRWAMVVDTRKLTEADCKRMIEACHRIHNVPDIGTKQEVKWIWTEEYKHAFPDDMNEFVSDEVKHKPFLMLCNHCDQPACVRVCPTKATYKRADGIVMMDMHRCIGCRFCMAACPFGARSFNFGDPRPYVKEENPKYPTRMRGVVEKCTFCTERLAEGLMPACVEVSNGALIFGDLDDPNSEVRQALRSNYSIRRKPNLGTQPCVYYIV